MNASPFDFSGTVLVRIDDDGSPGVFRITAVAYTTPILSTSVMPNCKTAQDTNFPGDVIPPAGGEVRPSVVGLTFDAAAHDLTGSSCQENFVFAGETFDMWTLITLQLDFSQTEPTPQSTGSFAFETLYATEAACNAGGNPETVNVLFDALYQSGPNSDSSNFTSDWDKDGCTDWNELNPAGNAQHLDPFAADCGVGGVAQLADAATALVAFGGNAELFLVGITLWGFCFWMATPTILRSVALWSLAPDERVGDAQSSMALGRAIGPAIGSVLVVGGTPTMSGMAPLSFSAGWGGVIFTPLVASGAFLTRCGYSSTSGCSW